MDDTPRLLEAASNGDKRALSHAFVTLYDRLHLLARRKLRGGQIDAVLDPSTLVHECYLRLMQVRSLKLRSYPHLLNYSAHIMHSIIVDSVRKRQIQRSAAALDTVTGDIVSSNTDTPNDENSFEIEVLLGQLAKVKLDPRLSRIVELRCVHDLTCTEIARNLNISERTVRREWQEAQHLLMPLQDITRPQGAHRLPNRTAHKRHRRSER